MLISLPWKETLHQEASREDLAEAGQARAVQPDHDRIIQAEQGGDLVAGHRLVVHHDQVTAEHLVAVDSEAHVDHHTVLVHVQVMVTSLHTEVPAEDQAMDHDLHMETDRRAATVLAHHTEELHVQHMEVATEEVTAHDPHMDHVGILVVTMEVRDSSDNLSLKHLMEVDTKVLHQALKALV